MTLDEVVTMAKEEGRDIARKEEHQPLAMLLKDGQLTLVSLQGDLPRNILPRVLAAAQPDAYVTVMEGRMSSHPATYPGEIIDNPDNPELLVIIACERGGPARLWTANISPSDNPGERDVGPWEDMVAPTGDLVIQRW